MRIEESEERAAAGSEKLPSSLLLPKSVCESGERHVSRFSPLIYEYHLDLKVWRITLIQESQCSRYSVLILFSDVPFPFWLGFGAHVLVV